MDTFLWSVQLRFWWIAERKYFATKKGQVFFSCVRWRCLRSLPALHLQHIFSSCLGELCFTLDRFELFFVGSSSNQGFDGINGEQSSTATPVGLDKRRREAALTMVDHFTSQSGQPAVSNSLQMANLWMIRRVVFEGLISVAAREERKQWSRVQIMRLASHADWGQFAESLMQYFDAHWIFKN